MTHKELSFIYSICSPVHNEETNIPHLIEEVRKVMEKLGETWEQVLVDDGSSDRSVQLIEEYQAKYGNIQLCRHEVNQGERAAWQSAFHHARGEIVLLIAADLQSPPKEIPKLLEVVKSNGADIGTAFRKDRKDGLFYWAATRVLNTFMNLLFGLGVKDVSSSFFAVKRIFVENIELFENDHRYILPILKRKGASMIEIAIEHQARKSGESHYKKSKVLYAIPEIFRFLIRDTKGVYMTKKAMEPNHD